MDTFWLNGEQWWIKMVYPSDPRIIDRTGKRTVATTDSTSHTMYLSWALQGDFLMRVMIHELSHCLMISYGLIEELHKMVYPEYWIEAEEWVCNLIADYGITLYKTMYGILGYDAWIYIPPELEKLLA